MGEEAMTTAFDSFDGSAMGEFVQSPLGVRNDKRDTIVLYYAIVYEHWYIIHAEDYFEDLDRWNRRIGILRNAGFPFQFTVICLRWVPQLDGHYESITTADELPMPDFTTVYDYFITDTWMTPETFIPPYAFLYPLPTAPVAFDYRGGEMIVRLLNDSAFQLNAQPDPEGNPLFSRAALLITALRNSDDVTVMDIIYGGINAPTPNNFYTDRWLGRAAKLLRIYLELYGLPTG